MSIVPVAADAVRDAVRDSVDLPVDLSVTRPVGRRRRRRGTLLHDLHPSPDRRPFVLALEQHVVDGREPDTGAEHVLDARSLAEQRVDDRRARRHQRRLAQVAEQGEDRVEPLPLAARHAERDAFAQLGEDHQVEDDRRGEQRVLARVVGDDRVPTAHHDLARVLVHRALAVADVRHVLDDDRVVGLLAGRVQQAVGRHHVVDDAALGYL